MLGLIVGAAIVVIIALIAILTYNGFVAKRNRVQDAWAQIDVQLKRRYDLIPNLINTVKGYMKYEQGVMTKITALRSSIVSGSIQDKAQANNQLSGALKSLFAVAENYPDLKASESFKNLQDQLAATEDKISFVRTSYNDYVLDYNNALQVFPGNVFSNIFHFKPSEFFKAPEEAEEPVKVDFSGDDSSDAMQPKAQKAASKKQKAQAQQPSAPKDDGE